MIAALYPMLALIHVFLDNARYHHAKLVQEWLARPGCRIKLHFIPSYCPHLNPIERLWGLMHRNVTHNKCYATCAQFADATLGFLRETVPRNWADLCNSVTDNFRVINPKDFRVMTRDYINTYIRSIATIGHNFSYKFSIWKVYITIRNLDNYFLGGPEIRVPLKFTTAPLGVV